MLDANMEAIELLWQGLPLQQGSGWLFGQTSSAIKIRTQCSVEHHQEVKIKKPTGFSTYPLLRVVAIGCEEQINNNIECTNCKYFPSTAKRLLLQCLQWNRRSQRLWGRLWFNKTKWMILFLINWRITPTGCPMWGQIQDERMGLLPVYTTR